MRVLLLLLILPRRGQLVQLIHGVGMALLLVLMLSGGRSSGSSGRGV